MTWAERMTKKGFLSQMQLDAEKARLRAAEIALDKALKDISDRAPPSKKLADKDSAPAK